MRGFLLSGRPGVPRSASTTRRRARPGPPPSSSGWPRGWAETCRPRVGRVPRPEGRSGCSPSSALLDGRTPRDEYVRGLLDQQARFEEVVTALRRTWTTRSSPRRTCAARRSARARAPRIGWSSSPPSSVPVRGGRRRPDPAAAPSHAPGAPAGPGGAGAPAPRARAERRVLGAGRRRARSWSNRWRPAARPAPTSSSCAEQDVAVAAVAGEGVPPVDTRVAVSGVADGRDHRSPGSRDHARDVDARRGDGAVRDQRLRRLRRACRPLFSEQERAGRARPAARARRAAVRGARRHVRAHRGRPRLRRPAARHPAGADPARARGPEGQRGAVPRPGRERPGRHLRDRRGRHHRLRQPAGGEDLRLHRRPSSSAAR